MRLTLLLLLMAGPAAAAPLSRAEAVARALEANPEVLKSREDRKILDGRGREALADALPELSALGTATRYRDPSLLNSSSFDSFPEELRAALKPVPANLYEGGLLVRQTLFNFKLGKAIKTARLAQELGSENILQVRQFVALQTLQAYDGYLLSLERVRVAEKAVRQKQEHLEMARLRRTAGVATELDVLRSEVDLENTRAVQVRLEGARDLSRSRLNALMVRPVETAIEPTDELRYVPWEVGLEETVQEAWANRPESRGIALSERIHELLIGIARSDSRPSLELGASYAWSVREPSNFLQSDFAKWSATASLKVPVFDGFRTKGKVEQARASRNKVTQDRVALETSIRLEAQEGVDVLRVSRRLLEAADLNLSQAQKALDMTQANYRHGAATTLDVLDAQAALTAAESNRIEALYGHSVARATLRYVMGRDPLEPPQTPEGTR